ncbi:MAG: hypothetical protein GX565_05150 [Lentisphaerae bacterium]|nr:hypothetical protein [Lentisphaerota bacterium]
MKRQQMQIHRLCIIIVWLTLLLALFIYPGFEAKGFAFGIIIGYWPFALLGELSPTLTLLTMFALSAIQVWLCAWLMDKSHLSGRYIAVVAIFILAGVLFAYGLNVNSFDHWKHGKISIVVPESYEITISDFRRDSLIPSTIVGGMFGLYLAVAIGALLTAGKILLKKRIEQSVPGYAAQGASSPEP